MKVFVVLSGGGVKGPALAGALHELKEREIEITGIAGCSAGSIIGLLLSVGYNGDDILKYLLNDIKPTNLLDDKGLKLEILQKTTSRISHTISKINRAIKIITHPIQECKNIYELICIPFVIFKFLLFCLYNSISILNVYDHILNNFGLYKGKNFKDTLESLIKKSPRFSKRSLDGNLTFQTLNDAGCIPLKIIASDLSKNKVAIYSKDNSEYSENVIDAVYHSSSYPFLFAPSLLSNGSIVIDGGLISNLPSFLFDTENNAQPCHILAFRFEDELEVNPTSIGTYLISLYNTYSTGSDKIFLDILNRVHAISIKIPSGINALDFSISDEQIKSLFTSGKMCTSTFLNSFPILKAYQYGNLKLLEELQLVYSDRKLIQPILESLVLTIQKQTSALDVRASIMVFTGKPDHSRIPLYWHTSDKYTDSEMTLEGFAGATGDALRSKCIVFDMKENWEKNTDFRDYCQFIPNDRNSICTIPIFAWKKELETCASIEYFTKPSIDREIIGFLSIDTSTELTSTGWVVVADSPDHGKGPDKHFLAILINIANILVRVMR